jgi:hypothetical protein
MYGVRFVINLGDLVGQLRWKLTKYVRVPIINHFYDPVGFFSPKKTLLRSLGNGRFGVVADVERVPGSTITTPPPVFSAVGQLHVGWAQGNSHTKSIYATLDATDPQLKKPGGG